MPSRTNPSLRHLLYLHGFRSSPQSTKAQLTRAWFAQHHPQVQVLTPQLPPSPQAAAQLMLALTGHWPSGSMAVMGSSLGGYYASWFAVQRQCPAVLLNPAVEPARDLAAYIGQVAQWHQPEESFDFRPEYIDELRALDTRHVRPAPPTLVLMAKGDEVLDWREMQARHADAQHIVLEGGDHALSEDFTPQLPVLAQFLLHLGQPPASADQSML
ncbi:YqiA/YcfP family alpha/beta fold hydrolase [Vandammella animalimorsus]|uniref:Esterase n=1 Tax=Vandammella animalimorsus TaxID=2029117 RepID=A0A2A2AAP3_9BURK|nr:YqiA/YcfP family alpha/beta fold hydrolase [Vandammella animalimorsus]PAT34794.1 esterase [Vandammella animalimorsus]